MRLIVQHRSHVDDGEHVLEVKLTRRRKDKYLVSSTDTPCIGTGFSSSENNKNNRISSP